MSAAITADSLCIRFGEMTVLNNVSFEVPAGTIFGLLGPSGAGKTTLVKLLTGQLKQDQGSATLRGTDTRNLTEKEKKQIGAMMDNYGLYGRLSVYDNLSFYADIYGTPKREITDILNSIGLYESRKTPVDKLSKGMKNRLSLGRALMNHAKILFLDEPTSALDPATTREIHEILLEQKENRTAIFLTTHNMYEAESLCDEVALLSRGSIIEHGRLADICRKYDHLKKIRIMLKNGTEIMLENNSDSASAIKEYLEHDMIDAIHSTEPTLETVFIELTGRGPD